eukprot:108142-Amphidinium_carterae.1
MKGEINSAKRMGAAEAPSSGISLPTTPTMVIPSTPAASGAETTMPMDMGTSSKRRSEDAEGDMARFEGRDLHMLLDQAVEIDEWNSTVIAEVGDVVDDLMALQGHVDEPEEDFPHPGWVTPAQEHFVDEYTGELLPRDGICQARWAEMDYLRKLGVWEYVPYEQAKTATGRAPIGTRWVDCDKKGGAEPDNPEYRSRLVVQETRGNSTIAKDDIAATFSATPPLEGLRMLCSLAISTPKADDLDKDFVIRLLDISRAHQNCDMTRDVYIRLPREDPRAESGEYCGLLRKALNGVRDAAQAFERRVCELLGASGIQQGSYNPCTYSSSSLRLALLHHGDDFVIVGPRSNTDVAVDALKEGFLVKDRGMLGPRSTDLKNIQVLNRTLRWSQDGDLLEYEADLRHVPLLLEQVGLKSESKSLSTPGEKIKPTPALEKQVEPMTATIYKSAAMRLAYLALDRPEISYAAKECAR